MPAVTLAAPHRAWSLFDLTVVAAERISPHLARITLSTDRSTPPLAEDTDGRTCVSHFADCGFDQRIKVLLPARRDGDIPLRDAAAWHRDLRALPDDERPVVRTYTVRALRGAGGPHAEIDIDFVLHGADGPASAWASDVLAGGASTVTLLGPDARFDGDPGGRAFVGATSRDLLIAGDETALPAIAAIVDRLDRAATGTALIEVPTTSDSIPLGAPEGFRVEFLPRGGRAHGERLVEAALAWSPQSVRVDTEPPATDLVPDEAWDRDAWEVPDRVAEPGLRAWIAGEASAVRAIRRHLVGTCGLSRDEVAFMGYWRLGRSEN